MFRKYEKDYASKLTEEEIRKNFKIVAEMEPVRNIRENVLDRYEGKPDKQLIQYFDSLNRRVITEYGEVGLTKKSAKDINHHSLTKLKAYGVDALISVLKKGKVIYYKKDYKKTGKDRLDIAAPVEISKGLLEGKYIMGVAVIVSPASKRVSLLELAIEKESYEATIGNKLPTHGSDSSSMLTLLQQVIDVKNGTRTLDQVTAIGIDSK